MVDFGGLKMRGIELEEGEAFFIQADHDDDENIDPDKDFSYLDRKIEKVLGHYQKEFIGGISPRSLGARYGGYGSFLPMTERIPPILSNQQNQSQVTLKSPRNFPSETLSSQNSSQNSAVTAKTSLPARDVPSNFQGGLSLRDVGVPSKTNQGKLQNSGEGAVNHQQQPKKPTAHHSEPNLLKFRVKMASESVLARDNSAIYSGLGLDISPTSSLEGSPSEKDGISPSLLEMKAESPSFITKTMTSTPLPNEALISPLHEGLICLMEVENIVETALPGFVQAEPLDLIDQSAYLEPKKEANKDSKDESTVMKERKQKQKHTSMEQNINHNIQMHRPIESVRENYEVLAKSRNLSASRKPEVGISVAEVTVSLNACPANSKETDKRSDSKASGLFDKKTDVGCVGEDTYRKQVQVARQKMKDELGCTPSDLVVDGLGNGYKPKGKAEKDKSTVAVPKLEPIIDKRTELGYTVDVVNRGAKPLSVVKVKVREDSICPKEESVYTKENEMQEKTPKDEETGSVSLKHVKDNGKHYNIPQEVKYFNSENFETPKQSSLAKAVSHGQMGHTVKEPSPFLTKKILKDSHADDVPVEPSKGSMGVKSSGIGNEEAVRGNILSRSKKVDLESHRELRKDNEAAINENPTKKGKEVSSRNFTVGVSERETQLYTSKVKEQSSSKKSGFPNTGYSEGGVAGGNCLTDRVSVGELPPTANAMPLEMDNWVGCEKCNKWRLLPFGMNPESLPKKWVCSMITWLPGMNKCSVSEDETTNAVRAQFPALLPPLQVNNPQDHLNRFGYVHALAAPQNVSLPNPVAGTGKKKNLGKPEIDADEQSGAHDLHRPIKKDQPDSGRIRSSKNLKPLQDTDSVKNAAGDGRPSKISNKRVAESDVSGVPKKVKLANQQPVKDSDIVGLLPVVTKGESQNPDASRFLQNFVPENSHAKFKDSGRMGIIPKSNESRDVSEKKRKSRDKRERSISAEAPFDIHQQPLNKMAGIESKSNASNFEAREKSAEKGLQRAHGDDSKHQSGHANDGRKRKGARTDGISGKQYQADRISQKTADTRKTSGKTPDMGWSDNATTSSSSKVSVKLKSKAREVKSSPVGSISSSPLKLCKSNAGEGTKKIIVSSNEPEEMSYRKRQKSRVENARVPDDFVSPNEGTSDRKSYLSKTSGLVPNSADGSQYSKISSGREPSTDRASFQPKSLDYKHSGDELDHRYPEATMAFEQKPENHALNGLHFHRTYSEHEKSNIPSKDSEKESLVANSVPESGKVSMSNSVRVVNDSGKLSRHAVEDNLSLRHPHQIGNVAKDIEASTSKRKDSLPWDARTALKEATNLKHSANRLKTAGSGQSTGIFFQAALKFFHGASLLEPGNNETSTEVYRTTANLCEYCAQEFEKRNDMASAALAYKCMEFGFMRVIYYNDVIASRDRLELQMAVRTPPQVESPSSSASDIDNLNNHVAVDAARDGHSAIDHRNHVISAGNRPNFSRLLRFTHDVNLAMEASRRSLGAFAAANTILSLAGNEEGISSIKRVLDFSFRDVDGFLHLVRLAMDALDN